MRGASGEPAAAPNAAALPALGVIMLETRFPRPHGDVGHPLTWRRPVLFRVVPKATVGRVVHDGPVDRALERAMIEAAVALEADGAGLITTGCGFLAPLQPALQAAVRVPVVASALAVLSLLRAQYGREAPLGVLTFDAGALGRHRFGPWWDDHLVVEGIERGHELYAAIACDRTTLDQDLACRDVLEAAGRLLRRRPEVRALVLECTNFPPYREAVAAQSQRPVFDLVGLVEWMRAAAPGAPCIDDPGC